MVMRSKCGVFGCRNRLIYLQQAGMFPNAINDMKKEKFNGTTGASVTVTSTINFIVGVFVNGVRYEESDDYTVAGKTITFLVALANDNVVVVYL